MGVPKGVMRAAFICLVLLTDVSAQQPTRRSTGLWLTDGYGLLVDDRGDSLHAYELTSISCIPSWTVKWVANSNENSEDVFAVEDLTFRLSAGSTKDAPRLHVDGAASDILLRHTPSRPTSCARTAKNSPQQNYAIFWQTFTEHYAFFDLRHMDWQSVDRKFRPQVSSKTTPKELFAIFREMIKPLHDAHTGVDAPDIKEEFDGWREDPAHLENGHWEKAQKLIDSRYVRGSMRSFCNGRVQFGTLDHSVGYLRITAFYGYLNKYTYADELRTLQTALDTIFQDSKNLSALVIDVRQNQGGDDPLGIEIASRLTDHKYLAYSKVTRNNLDGPLHFTAAQQDWVEPSNRPGFRGSVVLLTGPDTVSAGETFAMALLDRLPHVTRIGRNTQGVFSDVLSRRLPNGWRFDLPNEVYLTSDGKAFDATGVPPDVQIGFFSPEDFRNWRDAALEEALKFLGPATHR